MTVTITKPEILVNPFSQMEKALEHKLRNLKKRDQRLQQLKADKESGKIKLVSEQIEALSKMDEIKLQIASIEELQKLNVKQFREYKKAMKAFERQKLKNDVDSRSSQISTSPSQPTESVQSSLTSPSNDNNEEKKITILKKEEVEKVLLIK